MFRISFDIDGTLVDNKKLIRAAYEAAGVELTDIQWENVWGRPFSEWLVKHLGGDYEKAWRVHQDKNRHYPLLRERVGWTPLSGLTVAKYLCRFPTIFSVRFITGSSHVAANFVLEYFGLPLENVHAGLAPDGKVHTVVEHDCLHIDDDFRVVEAMNLANRPCIRYDESLTAEQLVEKIQEMDTWTPSSWPPVAVHD